MVLCIPVMASHDSKALKFFAFHDHPLAAGVSKLTSLVLVHNFDRLSEIILIKTCMMWNAGKVRKEKNGPVLPRLWRSKQSPGALISLTLVPINASENEASSDSPAPSGASSFKFRIGTSGKSDEMQSMRNWLREGKLGENTNDSNRSVETMISPLITYLRLFGLINKTKTTWLRKPLLVYNVLVLTFLITLTMLIGMMKNRSMPILAELPHNTKLFLSLELRINGSRQKDEFFIGGLSACFLFIIQKRLDELIAFVIKQISVIDTNFYYAKRVRHVCKMMVTFVFLGSCITVLFNSILYIEIRDKRYAGTAFQAYYLLVDYYVVFMAQTALISSTIFYALLNYILAQCLDKFIEDMRRSGILLDDKEETEWKMRYFGEDITSAVTFIFSGQHAKMPLAAWNHYRTVMR
ncbi:unnamed protein product [Thelazia callipaeda]|uniref:Gustatory receptor n=1 Tax=Thelazia callipaeda TaxID=103827 RepID=A0A0N5D7W4_THECL|nr:unnamed protein product [Thelazia callipaeda]